MSDGIIALGRRAYRILDTGDTGADPAFDLVDGDRVWFQRTRPSEKETQGALSAFPLVGAEPGASEESLDGFAAITDGTPVTGPTASPNGPSSEAQRWPWKPTAIPRESRIQGLNR
jgi:hypothetical protein